MMIVVVMMMSILTSPSPLLSALAIHILLTFHLLLLPSLSHHTLIYFCHFHLHTHHKASPSTPLAICRGKSSLSLLRLCREKLRKVLCSVQPVLSLHRAKKQSLWKIEPRLISGDHFCFEQKLVSTRKEIYVRLLLSVVTLLLWCPVIMVMRMSILTSPSPLLPALSIHILLTFHLLLLPALSHYTLIVIVTQAHVSGCRAKRFGSCVYSSLYLDWPSTNT